MGMAEGQPGVDKRQYARETGQAIQGLPPTTTPPARKEALALAVAARRLGAARARAARAAAFATPSRTPAGPYLADSVEMGAGAAGAASLDRRPANGCRPRSPPATSSPRPSSIPGPAASSPRPRPTPGICPKPIKQREDNVTATRFFTLLAFYSGDSRYREIAEAGMGYLASPAILEAMAFLPDVLLAEEELRNEPVHVDRSSAPRTIRAALRSTPRALAYPLAYKRAEWWDKREGTLANPDVDYPDYPDGPAAFACTRNFCSLPVTDPAAIPRSSTGCSAPCDERSAIVGG